MNKELGYVAMEISGIQKFILSTGRLKEMLCGSELVYSVFGTELIEIAKEYQLIQSSDKNYPKCPVNNEILVLQLNAGVTHLLFSSLTEAKRFLTIFSKAVNEKHPGLPLFGAAVEVTWDGDSIKNAREAVAEKIRIKRATYKVNQGLQMQPFCAVSALDNLPAVAFENGKKISLLSKTKSFYKQKDSFKDRFSLNEIKNNWTDDLEKISNSKNKIALIHMDGNDLGRLFIGALEDLKKNNATLEDGIKEMASLSELIEKANKEAFEKAVKDVLSFEGILGTDKVIPLRPLVLGGDDVTVLIKADLALLFVQSYVAEFEKITSENKQKLTLGVGMVISSSSYPFSKSFALAESLIENAKKHTAMMTPRPSSIDYLVVTNDLEWDLEEIRDHLYRTKDNFDLTAKPYLIKDNEIADLAQTAYNIQSKLSRTALREMLGKCRAGIGEADKAYEKMKKNLDRGLGGRNSNSIMSTAEFEKIFEKSFFDKEEKTTKLGDYLELAQLLPEKNIQAYIKALENNSNKD